MNRFIQYLKQAGLFLFGIVLISFGYQANTADKTKEAVREPADLENNQTVQEAGSAASTGTTLEEKQPEEASGSE